jgi:hypothetical protein
MRLLVLVVDDAPDLLFRPQVRRALRAGRFSRGPEPRAARFRAGIGLKPHCFEQEWWA